MAITIKSIPVLYKEAASNFHKKVDKNTANRSSIDFSKEKNIADKILAKANM